ncbi:MAG: hypothetical protein HGA98_03090 [Deltaproteobacteria bacterium]|nr:hypothetical protein [Deltaproteobacteria bacterium]
MSADDALTERYLRAFRSQLGVEVIATLPTPLRAYGLPPSTLHTYHGPTFYYLARTRWN